MKKKQITIFFLSLFLVCVIALMYRNIVRHNEEITTTEEITATTETIQITTETAAETEPESTGTTTPYTTVPAEETTTVPETTAEQKETSAEPAKPKTTMKKTQPKTTAKPKTTKPVTTTKKPVTTTKPKPTTTTKRQEQGQFLSSASGAVSNINARRTANKLVTLKKSGSLQTSAESKAKAKSGVLYSCNGKMSAAAAAGKIVAAYPGIISNIKYKNYGCAVWYDGTKSYLVFLFN